MEQTIVENSQPQTNQPTEQPETQVASKKKMRAKRTSQPYSVLVLKAIKAAPKDTQVSYIRICKHVEATNPPRNYRLYVRKALKNLVRKGTLVQTKHSYTLKPRDPTPNKNEHKKPAVKCVKITNSNSNTLNRNNVEQTQGNSASLPTSSQRKPIWQYYDAAKGGDFWFNYDPSASDAVEKVYQDWLVNPGNFDVREVCSGTQKYHYLVDFRQFNQVNIDHENHTVRNIRRFV